MSAAVSDPQLLAVALAACRVAGVCMLAPVLASRVVPRRIALAFAVALGVAALPSLSSSHAVADAMSLSGFVVGALAEFVTGAVLGFMAALPIAALRCAGALEAVQMGVGFGGLYGASDATVEGEGGDGIESLMAFAAIAMFVWAGGLESLALGVLRSFEYLPLAQWGSLASLPALLGHGLLACSELAVRVALPVTAVLVVELLVTGLMTRTNPSLGPVQFGFPVRVAIGLVAMLAGCFAMQDAMNGVTATLLNAAHEWTLGGGA